MQDIYQPRCYSVHPGLDNPYGNTIVKILYHHRTLADGAEGIHIAEMVGAFRNLGHSVDVVCPRAASSVEGMVSEAQVANGRLIRLRSYLPRFAARLAEIFYNMISYHAVRRAIRRLKPDFVYERYSAFSFGGILAAKKARIPTILEVNATFTGRLGSVYSLYFPWVAGKVERYALSNSAGIAVVSQTLKECLLDMGVPPAKIIVTPNGINPNKVRHVDTAATRENTRIRLGISECTVIGFVGSLRSYHGIDLLIKSIPAICSAEPHAHFLIVGAGEMEKHFREFVHDQDLEHRVTFTGGVAHSEVFHYIAAMDIAVMPHSNPFGSPMKVLEYMAMGRAVVAPRLGPLAELIEDDVNGKLITPGDEHDFVRTVIRLIREPGERKSLGTRAQDHVLAKHTWERNAREVVGLCRASVPSQQGRECGACGFADM